MAPVRPRATDSSDVEREVGDVLPPRVRAAIPSHNREPSAGADDGPALACEYAALLLMDAIENFELRRVKEFIEVQAVHGMLAHRNFVDAMSTIITQ